LKLTNILAIVTQGGEGIFVELRIICERLPEFTSKKKDECITFTYSIDGGQSTQEQDIAKAKEILEKLNN